MLSLLDTGVTDRMELVHAAHTHCIRCRRGILWMMTYRAGKPLPFDADPLPARFDVERLGWAPGMFPIGGRQRRCMAPRSLHPPHTHPANVLTVHECLRAAA